MLSSLRHLKGARISIMTMATRRFYSVPSRVAVLGAGSFGSAMVKVVERALLELAEDSTSTTATPTISWYARRQSIVDEINTQQTNQQYFEGGVFDASIVKATTNLVDCVSEAQVVILAVPSNYLPPILQEIDSKLDDRAVLVSVLKSIHYDSEERAVTTPIDEIRRVLSSHPIVALSGPNLYKEMTFSTADGEFAEATVGHDPQDESAARTVQLVTSSACFQTSLCSDRIGVELCGGLKNVLSLATGYCEGLGMGSNVKAAMLRAGMHEMARFIQLQEERNRDSAIENSSSDPYTTVFETAAGMGDVILTCTAGRGRMLAAEFVKHGQQHGYLSNKDENVARWNELETNLLNGMKLPDWHNAQYVYQALQDWKCLEEFPLFEAVYKIGFEGKDPRYIVTAWKQSIQRAGARRRISML